MQIPDADTLKLYSDGELAALAENIRERILSAVSKNGGHLASNLGLVETTLALHRVLSVPEDTVVFDVGHQCYTHKILTGRGDEMDTLRKAGGLSGFPNREESDADPFTTGHSGTALSAALGLAEAARLAGRDNWTAAVIGDGSFGNGMVYEALQSAARPGLRLLILLNDNEMSISKNRGGLSDYFAKIRTSRGYFAFKHGVHRFARRIPFLGRPLIFTAIHVKEFLKRLLNKKNVFESLGLEYLGPMDGHNLPALESVLREAMRCDRPCVVHVITKKGKGYALAEEHPDRYHSVPPFDPAVGVSPAGGGFSEAFGEALVGLAETDERLCAVTAAMAEGTGLSAFQEKFPDRFFDAGIAEEHAVTFAAGLSRAGYRPVVALYSTFAQRVFDQALHDVAMQKLPLVLALDRCGLIPGDGVTHQGLFDVGLFTPIPGVTVYSPFTYDELRSTLAAAVQGESLSVIRYPRGGEKDTGAPWETDEDGTYARLTLGNGEKTLLLITYGSETVEVLKAARALSLRYRVEIFRLIRLTPLPTEALGTALQSANACLFAEEAMRRGGIGEAVAAMAAETVPGLPFAHLGLCEFIPHGVTAEDLPISAEAIARRAMELL